MTQTISRELKDKLKSVVILSDVWASASCNWEEKGVENTHTYLDVFLDKLVSAALEVRGIAMAEPSPESNTVVAKANKTVDAILQSLTPKAIQDAIRTHFKLSPNWNSRRKWESDALHDWMEWAMEVKMTEAQIEHAANLWRSDKRWNWKIPDLKGIREHWPALVEDMEVKNERPEFKPFVADNVGNLVSSPYVRKDGSSKADTGTV